MPLPLDLTTPSPSATIAVNPDLVTPGPFGFAIIALLAVVVVFLVIDMQRRIRRGRVRADIQDELDAEAAERGSIQPEDPRG